MRRGLKGRVNRLGQSEEAFAQPIESDARLETRYTCSIFDELVSMGIFEETSPEGLSQCRSKFDEEPRRRYRRLRNAGGLNLPCPPQGKQKFQEEPSPISKQPPESDSKRQNGPSTNRILHFLQRRPKSTFVDPATSKLAQKSSGEVAKSRLVPTNVKTNTDQPHFRPFLSKNVN